MTTAQPRAPPPPRAAREIACSSEIAPDPSPTMTTPVTERASVPVPTMLIVAKTRPTVPSRSAEYASARSVDGTSEWRRTLDAPAATAAALYSSASRRE